MTSSNFLTLVGVGPGDPSLLTLAAVQAIQESTLVAYPVAREGDESIAAKIASPWITAQHKCLPLLFPMVNEAEPRQQAWREASKKLVDLVANGEKIVFLCQGDVSLFASSSYLLLSIKTNYPDCPIRLIPGVTAIATAAAVGEWPLALQKDRLLVLPAPNDPKSFEALLDESFQLKQVIALLKLGDRWKWIRPILRERGLLDEALFAQRLGLPDQRVQRAIEVSADIKNYLSLLLIRQSWPDVMP